MPEFIPPTKQYENLAEEAIKAKYGGITQGVLGGLQGISDYVSEHQNTVKIDDNFLKGIKNPDLQAIFKPYYNKRMAINQVAQLTMQQQAEDIKKAQQEGMAQYHGAMVDLAGQKQALGEKKEAAYENLQQQNIDLKKSHESLYQKLANLRYKSAEKSIPKLNNEQTIQVHNILNEMNNLKKNMRSITDPNILAQSAAQYNQDNDKLIAIDPDLDMGTYEEASGEGTGVIDKFLSLLGTHPAVKQVYKPPTSARSPQTSNNLPGLE